MRMIAATPTPSNAAESQKLPPSILVGRGELVRFTVNDVLVMLAQGILPEDGTTELLNGLVVLKDRGDDGEDRDLHGPKHGLCVRRLTKLAAIIEGVERHVQIQLPVICGVDQMPEPDFAIIRGADEAYAERLPTASEALCVVEVADSSYERDSQEKLPVYAAAGLPQYFIVNLRNDTIEEYSDPDVGIALFRSKVTLSRGQSVTLKFGEDQTLNLPVTDILP
jgi:hypothetical protein